METDYDRFLTEASKEFSNDLIFEKLRGSHRDVDTDTLWSDIEECSIFYEHTYLEKQPIDALCLRCIGIVNTYKISNGLPEWNYEYDVLRGRMLMWYFQMKKDYEKCSMLEWLSNEKKAGNIDAQTCKTVYNSLKSPSILRID